MDFNKSSYYDRDKLTTAQKWTHGIWQFIKYTARIFLDIFILLIIIAIPSGFYLYAKTPINTDLLTQKVAQTSFIYDRTGQHILYEIHGEENRTIIAHDEIPDDIRICTVAAEDNNFYSHPGIDFKAMLRALKTDVSSNEAQQGASTITQQLARNVFLTRDKTVQRKLSEIILALKIEKNYTKDQILDMYLNEVPYGSNAYGVQSAAQTFFGKDAKDLTLDEAAMLAALTNATSYYSPYGNHVDELVKKQQVILEKVKELKLASADEVNQAESVNTMDKIIPLKQAIEAPHFVFYIKEQLEKTYGQDTIEKGGLKIYTTLDWDKQQLAESIISSQLPDLEKKYGATNAALVSIDPKTGQILAMVGSRDYFDKSIDGQVNVATSPRQPGSSFKPFAYATAFEKGYEPETKLYDVPTDFGPDGSGHDYKPNNYDGKSHGLVTMRQALANSLNIPSVKTLYLAGVKDTIATAQSMGVTTLTDPNRYGLALVLGGAEVTLLDETSAYGVFANDGQRNVATGILKIVDASGNTFYQSTPQNTPVIDSQIARKIDSILSDNGARSMIFGPNSQLYIPGRQVAAKTGTTQDFHDAWIVGFTPSVVTGVWAGNNNNTAMNAGADGSYVAAPIWNAYMSQALNGLPDENFPDYDHSYLAGMGNAPDIKYVNKNTGKELSGKKLANTDPSKIQIQLDFSGSTSSFPQNIPAIVELQNTTDPMILRWQASLQDVSNLDTLNGGSDNQDSQNKNSKHNQNNND